MKTLTVKACLIIYCLLWMSSCRSSIPFISSPHHRPQGIYHTVKSKETLWRICQTYNVKMQEIAEINNISKTSQIKIGDKIFIPGAKKQYRVILPKAKQPLHRKTNPKIIKSSTVFAWPVRGKVLRRFGMQNGQKHDGINIKAAKGKTIKASR
ncbi:MAG: LysM peptidoglycan-binding domain-containing protein, partial [Deltaproteobacteria bacterium]|nr:LysM peptidoglycan-binding domain-containing protein [Deltaproteobacteria bacterium]